jgi:hypothetical protein
MGVVFDILGSDKPARDNGILEEGVSEARRRSQEHRQRCRHLPPLQKGEAERLIAEFLATRGSVTVCPPAYLLPVR